MTAWILAHEPTVRLAAFLGVFAAVAAWEWGVPRKRRVSPKGLRWLNNLGLVVANTAAIRVLLPAGAVGMAVHATDNGWGLVNALDLPTPVAIVGCVVALDLAIYVQHMLFHIVPPLWRLHLVHHADPDMDVTTGARFHPVEILLSMGIKIGLVAALGAPPVAVIVFEVVLNATAMFNHGNARLPLGLDRVVRWFIVTPDMHRVHHSQVRRETNSNYGFNLSCWDRLFRTYRAQPEAGHDAMRVGLADYSGPRALWIPWLLVLPFIRATKSSGSG